MPSIYVMLKALITAECKKGELSEDYKTLTKDKLNRFLETNNINQEEYDELIAIIA